MKRFLYCFTSFISWQPLAHSQTKLQDYGKYTLTSETIAMPDGIRLATLRWIRRQSWSNGKIGGYGGSYVGCTQWAVADSLAVLTPDNEKKGQCRHSVDHRSLESRFTGV